MTRRRASRPCCECGTEFLGPRFRYCSHECYDRQKKRTAAEWRAANSGYHALWRYGLTPEQVQAMIRAQGGLCAICRRQRKLDVDHCHKSGKVRGLICRACNVALGLAQDCPEILDRMRAYLGS